jgi:BlaI family transcriptional regulator, penicillinase repressor
MSESVSSIQTKRLNIQTQQLNTRVRMGRPARDITESELAVLRILWDRGMATIRHLTDVLYPGGGAAQYATVQKLLDRMEAKEFVRRDRSLFVHRFVPVLDRDQLIGRRLRSLVETLCDGSLTPLLTHLARAGDLTDEDRQALRAIIEESERDDLSQEIAPESLDARKQDALVTARQSRTGPRRLPRS